MATILVVDDDRDICNLLTDVLEGEGYAVQAVMDGQAALSALRHQPFDLALVDILLPGLSGLDLLKRLKEQVPAMPVILITCKQDPETILQALRAGAGEYVTKPFDLAYLRAAVRQALDKACLPLAQASHRSEEEEARWASLSDREREVLARIAAGQSNKQIAQTLAISERTVETHVGNLLEKLGVTSRTEAAVWVWAHGFAAEMGLSGGTLPEKNGGFS